MALFEKILRNKKLRSVAEESEAGYLELIPKIQKLREKLDEARVSQVSRAETMRLMRQIVVNEAERDFGSILDGRISLIWQDAWLDEANLYLINPGLQQRFDGTAILDFIYLCAPDLILDGLSKRIDRLIPKSVTLTLAGKRRLISDIEAEISRLESVQGDHLATFRMVVGNPSAIPGKDPIPQAEAPHERIQTPDPAPAPAQSARTSTAIRPEQKAEKKSLVDAIAGIGK